MIKQYHPLEGRRLTFANADFLDIRPGDETSRFSLRIEPAAIHRAGEVFDLQLPEKIGGLSLVSQKEESSKTAICVGPDEWYLTAPVADHDKILTDFAELYENQLHSLVDISNREISIRVEGKHAAYLLQSPIAFDVENMPVMSGRRTLFDKVQVILMRESVDKFRLEVWASFAEHVWHILETLFNEIKAQAAL